MTSYLLISSAYRDRLLYPSPSDFIVPFQNTNNSLTTVRSSVLTAVNPLSLYPAYSFCWTNLTSGSLRFRTRITGGSGETMVLSRDDVNTTLLGIGGNEYGVWQELRRSNDLLKSYRVELVADPSQSAYVRSFSPVYSSVTLTERLPFRIGDEIDLVNDTRLSEGRIVLPGSYNGKLFVRNDLVLYDLTTNEKRACALEAVSSILICDSPFSPAARPTDKFLLFAGQRPFLTGSLERFLDGRWYADAALREWRIVEAGRGYLAGERVALARGDDPEARTTCVFRVVGTGVDGEITALERIEAGTDPYRSAAAYRVVPLDRPVDTVSAAHVLVLATSTAFRCRFSEAATITRQDLVGSYLSCSLFSPLFTVHQNRLYTSPNAAYPVPVTGPDLRTMQEAAGVIGIEDVLFLGRNEVVLLTQAVSPALLRRFGLYEPTAALAGALNVAVFPYVTDGVVPLNFTGTYLTQSQMACYEITVLSLILPNVPLDALDTLLTSGYPYVLLEISNVSQPNAHNRNVLYSNNPAAVASTFVCSISDVNDPLRTRFIKITSDGTIQTMKFTPADSLRFRVLLPSGDPLLLSEPDYGPPSVANPALQIEALLQFRKI
ncbi:hypothetical protein EBZ80_04900 [bacterium]|nr:hypothetical protein [bacterium]